MKLNKLKNKKVFTLPLLAFVLITVVVVFFTVRQDKQDIQEPDTTQWTQYADIDVTEPTDEVEQSTEEASSEDVDEFEPESTEEAASNSKVEPSTANKTSTTKETTTINSANVSTKPQFDYIDILLHMTGEHYTRFMMKPMANTTIALKMVYEDIQKKQHSIWFDLLNKKYIQIQSAR